jgi:hypothetical protein
MRSVVAAVFVAVLATACGSMLQAKNVSPAAAAKKDCAACEKMCSVAADAEKNPGAVDSCKADCKKTCTP